MATSGFTPLDELEYKTAAQVVYQLKAETLVPLGEP